MADSANHRMRTISLPSRVASTLAGSGVAASIDGFGATAGFNSPRNAAIHPVSGNLFVTDYVGHTIREVTPTGLVTTFAGGGAYGWLDGLGRAALFASPFGIAIDAGGNLVVRGD